MKKKAIITSDLHYGITSHARILHLKEQMLRQNPAVIILAGDIGEPAHNFRASLKLFEDVPCPVGVVIGNHDLYNTAGFNHSEELWNEVLPGIVKECGLVWMESETITIGETAFIGSMAWYDYSSRAPELNHLPDEFFFAGKGRFVSDGIYIDWKREDKDLAAELLERLLKRLKNAEEDPSLKRIIVVTHVPLFPGQMVHYRTDNPYADAYFGNFTAGKEISSFSKVTDVISGHTHRGVERVIGNIRARVVPSDYKKPVFIEIEI